MTIKKGHLVFWWHHYGKMIYTLEELKEFEKIIDNYGTDKVLDVAISSYIFGDGSPTVILKCVRNKNIEDLFNSLPDFSKMDEKEKKQYETVKNAYIKLLENM